MFYFCFLILYSRTNHTHLCPKVLFIFLFYIIRCSGKFAHISTNFDTFKWTTGANPLMTVRLEKFDSNIRPYRYKHLLVFPCQPSQIPWAPPSKVSHYLVPSLILTHLTGWKGLEIYATWLDFYELLLCERDRPFSWFLLSIFVLCYVMKWQYDTTILYQSHGFSFLKARAYLGLITLFAYDFGNLLQVECYSLSCYIKLLGEKIRRKMSSEWKLLNYYHSIMSCGV